MRPKIQNSPTADGLRAPLKTWAKAIRKDPATLSKRLRAAGHEVSAGKQYTAHDIFVAWVGDKEAALTREANARAEKVEMENAMARRALIPWEDVKKFIVSTYAPVREQVLAMPSVMAPRVNPTDPEHARRHLEEWADGMLAHCRTHTPEDPDAED